MRRPRYVARPDSSSSLLQALANALQGKGFPALGFPAFLQPVLPLLGVLPRSLVARGYGLGGRFGSLSPGRTGDVSAARAADWITSLYPAGPYPAVAIGSSNGALVHLCAAMQVPWLPQTFLTLVRQPGRDLDDGLAAVEHAREPGRRLLARNPALSVYQLHDPVNDRPVLTHSAYFRLKFRSLPPAYLGFLEATAGRNGTLIVVECAQRWPASRVGERHLFQFGGAGGVGLDEYFHGGPRVRDFLRRSGSRHDRWNPPAPDGRYPEAEWGFDPALRGEIVRWARRRGGRVVRLVFREPDALSPVVAELYRWWYRRRGVPAERLVVDSFFLLDPWWTIRAGAAPYWATFNTEDSGRALSRYLANAEPWREIHAMLLGNMVEAIGALTPEELRRIIEGAATGRAGLLGVKPDRHPYDPGTMSRYHAALKRLAPRRAVPAPLTVEELELFLRREAAGSGVQWIDNAD